MTTKQVPIEKGKHASVIYKVTDAGTVISEHAVDPAELYFLSHSVNVRILGLMVYEEDGKVHFFDDHDEIAARIGSEF